jgi:hypothetical protein
VGVSACVSWQAGRGRGQVTHHTVSLTVPEGSRSPSPKGVAHHPRRKSLTAPEGSHSPSPKGVTHRPRRACGR